MKQEGEPARILLIGLADALSDALQRLPYRLCTDFHQTCDLIVACAPIDDRTWGLIQDHNPRTPLLLVGGDHDTDTSARIAEHSGVHTLDDATPEALLAQIERLLPAKPARSAPPVEPALRRRSHELSILHAITEAVSQPLELQATLRAALDAIWQYTHFEAGAIVFYNAETQEFEPVVWDRVSQPDFDSFAPSPPDSHQWRVIQTGEPIFFPDIPAASARAGRALSFGANCVSGATLPLQARGRTLGLLILGSEHAHTFAPEERALLIGIARAVGVAIDTAQILAQHQQRADELALLNDIGMILQETTDLSDALTQTLIRIQQTLAFDALGVMTVDRATNRVVPFVSFNMPRVLKQLAAESAIRVDQLEGTDLFQKFALQTLSRFGYVMRLYDPRADVAPDASLTLVPLYAREAVHGVLNLVRYQHRPLAENERSLLKLIGHRIGIALENAQLYEEKHQRGLEVTALLAAAETLSANLGLKTRLEIITERAKRLIRADEALLFLLQDDGETLLPFVALLPEADKMRDFSIRLGEGLTGRVVLRGQGEIVNDPGSDPHAGLILPGIEHIPASYLSVPLRVEEHVLGAITLSRSVNRTPFSNSDLRLLASLANQAAIAVDNARLIDESNRQRHLAEALSRVSRLISETFNLDKVLDTILRELRSVLDFDSGQVRLVEGDEMRVAHSLGYPTDPMPEILKVDLSTLATSRWIVRNRRHLVIPDTQKYEEWQTLKGTERVRSWMGAPLISRGRVIGILSVESATPNTYTERHGAIITAFANQIAATIDNIRLFQQTEARERESRTLYEMTRLLVSLNVQAIPGYVLDKLQDAIHFDVGGMFVVGDPHRLVMLIARPLSDQTVHQIRDSLISFYRDLSGEPVNPRMVETQIIGDFHILPTMLPEDVSARLAAPLIIADSLIGCIQVSSLIPDAYGEVEERTLYTIATQTATALDNARLYETLKASHRSLKEAYDDLAEADRLKDELVRNVSHEIRTPLTFIKSYVELLLSGAMGELTSQQQNALDYVARKTNVLKGLMDDMLSLKKISADTLDLQLVDLGEIVRHAVEGFLPAATEAGLNVVVEIAPELPATMGDRGRLGQVMDNLLSNARKFSPEGTTITVRVLDDGPHLRVEVEDQGIGIPEDKLEKVFERFYQVDGSVRRRYGGAGLGLAISKQIIEAHSGKIGVTSVYGEGSLFYFQLYKARLQPEPDPTPAVGQ